MFDHSIRRNLSEWFGEVGWGVGAFDWGYSDNRWSGRNSWDLNRVAQVDWMQISRARIILCYDRTVALYVNPLGPVSLPVLHAHFVFQHFGTELTAAPTEYLLR